MSNLEKLSKITAGKESKWLEEAKWREANEDWLSFSFDIAVRVLDALKSKGMTQKELAEKMGVSPQFINKVVKGQENLSLETIGKLSKALGIRLVKVEAEEKIVEVKYDYAQAYEISEHYRQQFFAQANTQGNFDLKALQQYHSSQQIEFRIPA